MPSWVWPPLGEQRGMSLVETTVALTILALVSLAVLVGVSSSRLAVKAGEVQSVAENLARNQVEYVFEQPYLVPPALYSTIVPPADFSVTAEALEYVVSEPNVATVRVTVFHEGQRVLSVETLRSRY